MHEQQAHWEHTIAAMEYHVVLKHIIVGHKPVDQHPFQLQVSSQKDWQRFVQLVLWRQPVLGEVELLMEEVWLVVLVWQVEKGVEVVRVLLQ